MAILSHRGICVSDLEASTRFYKEALGFLDHADHGVVEGEQMARAMGLDDVRAKIRQLRHPDGPVIGLMQFLEPEATGKRERRSTLQYGLVHLSFYVDDIDAEVAKVVAAGGHAFDHTRAASSDDMEMYYCTDPDGVRIELMKATGVAPRFSHSGICVEDIDRSIAFYEELGFELSDNYLLDGGFDWLAKIMEAPGIRLRAQMIQDSAGNMIELLKVFEPDCIGPRERQPINRFGLTHLAFMAPEADTLTDRLASLGGTAYGDEHVDMGMVELFQLSDPDGVRLELVKPVAD